MTREFALNKIANAMMKEEIENPSLHLQRIKAGRIELLVTEDYTLIEIYNEYFPQKPIDIIT